MSENPVDVLSAFYGRVASVLCDFDGRRLSAYSVGKVRKGKKKQGKRALGERRENSRKAQNRNKEKDAKAEGMEKRWGLEGKEGEGRRAGGGG